MGFLATVYATDEDLARAASADFLLLLPPGQDVAYGSDGTFSHLSPWSLSSATGDFVNQGLADGQVVLLTLPASSRPKWWGSNGELFAVDGQPQSATSLNLRRVASPSGFGQSPCGPLDLSGVTYRVGTFYPQVEQASFDLNRELGIDPDIDTRSPSELRDLRELRMACVWAVLRDQYEDQYRNGGDVFESKLKNAEARLKSVKDRLAVRWLNNDQDTMPCWGVPIER